MAQMLDRALRVAAVILVLALLASVMTGVISRLVNRAVPWSDEMAQYLLVWTGFVGWMIAARRQSHIRITILVDLLPGWANAAAEILLRLALIGFALALLHWGWPLIGRNWDIDWVTLPLSAALLYVPVPFVAAVLIGQACVEIVEIWRAGARKGQSGANLA